MCAVALSCFLCDPTLIETRVVSAEKELVVVALLLVWAMVVRNVSPVQDPQWAAPSTTPPLSINLDLQ